MSNVLEGRWQQLKGDARRFWGKLTDDDLERAAGNKDKLVGALKERYGYHQDRAEQEFDRFVASVRQPDAADQPR